MAWEKCSNCNEEFFKNISNWSCPHCDQAVEEQQKKWKCRECGNRNSKNSRFCVSCGVEKLPSSGIETFALYCPECGAECSSEMENCSGCKMILNDSIQAIKKKQRSEKVKNFIFSLLDSIPEGQIRGPERINPEKIGKSLVGRKCPFCGFITLGSGPCTRCQR